MPKSPPRPLRLPELVTNPEARAEYIQTHPSTHSPYASSFRRDSSHFSNPPSSPNSTTDVSSHRASAATLASSAPMTPASTHTSLSAHSAAWISELGKRASGLAELLPTGDTKDYKTSVRMNMEDKKPRASWSSAIANTKSWFGSASVTESKNTSLLPEKRRDSKEIKLSPSMIATYAATPRSPRPLSSPYPSAAEPSVLSPTGSVFSVSRTPRVGSGLRYYTERDPAPTQARVQLPDPIYLEDHNPAQPTLLPQINEVNGATPTLTTFAGNSDTSTPQGLDFIKPKDQAMSGETRAPPSPPPTPPYNKPENDVPDIRVTSGDG